MSKHDILTEEDVLSTKVDKKILDTIHQYLEDTGKQKGEISILDWGSGRGQTVGWLRKQGYNAFGVEIDDEPYTNGMHYFKKVYENPQTFLQLIKPDCKTNFEDNSFDIIFTEQVFEHVEYFEPLVAEMSRVTKIGGKHIYRFPSKWHFWEAHLFMPMVHWLPKNKVRFLAISAFTILGIEPKWKELDNKTKIGKAKIYYQYSKNQTFYRRPSYQEKIFLNNGMKINFKFYKRRKHPLQISGYFSYGTDINATKLS